MRFVLGGSSFSDDPPLFALGGGTVTGTSYTTSRQARSISASRDAPVAAVGDIIERAGARAEECGGFRRILGGNNELSSGLEYTTWQRIRGAVSPGRAHQAHHAARLLPPFKHSCSAGCPQ
jgi:hypothetical protein